MNSEKNIRIHIKSTQTTAEGEKDTMEFYAEGKYIEKAASIYITYTESEISGMEGTTTTLKITGNEITLIRFGSIASKLNFQKDVKTRSKYETQYGAFDMVIHTQELSVHLSETDPSRIHLRYLLDIDGQGDVQNELSLSFTYA